ncbi:MAG: phage/plasmid primase, P4 family [Candidatus Auribacterota bacterium]|jgi:P4 family phage/plasmid primase-like protien|nr:phage/plasmid primase, P4 family [Candidatus Auribacterota bacterium]
MMTTTPKTGLIKVPDQLCDGRFGFVKLKRGSKRPFERNWQKRPYSLAQINAWIGQGFNYGVLGGHGGLIIIDTDSDEMSRFIERSFPPTFTVKTPKNGYHFYFIANNFNQKVVLQKDGTHHGEIISTGSQVVGAGSVHPDTGTRYEVYRDLPIAQVTQTQIQTSLYDYIKKRESKSNAQAVDNRNVTQTRNPQHSESQHNEQDISIDITRILDINGIQTSRSGNQLTCTHPIHGSSSGVNLVINPDKNVWHCFRCESGGDALLLIAVLERLIDCSQARPGVLQGELFKTTLQVAKDKYGLKTVSKPPPIHNADTDDLGGFFNDDWNARRFVDQHGSKLMNCDNLGGWHLWNGKVWELDETHRVMRLARDTVESFNDLVDSFDEDTQKLFYKHIKTSGNEAKLRAMTSVARSYENMSVKSSQFDADEYLLNCHNGVLDLKSGQMRDHSEKLLISKLCGTKFDPSAECPLWLEFLDTIFHGNDDLIRFVQKAVGYVLTGDVSHQMFFILHGAGANGKSTFVDTIYKMLGSYAMITPTSTLTAKRGNEIPNDVARLKGARFIVASELSRSSLLDESLIKQLTSTEPLSARYLHKEFFEFRPTGKVFLSTNYKPTIRGTDDGIWRRIKLIPFDHKFEGDKKIENYAQKYLFPELPGILRWAVDGFAMLQAEGFHEPEAIMAATNQYKESEDIIGSFLRENCVLQSHCRCLCSELYDLYKQMCDVRIRKKDFNDYLLKCGYTRERGSTGKYKGQNYWQGIGIKDLLNNDEHDVDEIPNNRPF